MTSGYNLSTNSSQICATKDTLNRGPVTFRDFLIKCTRPPWDHLNSPNYLDGARDQCADHEKVLIGPMNKENFKVVCGQCDAWWQR